ncbi:MAG: tetratricopeptide repeat protein [Niameybacter sp.]|uniref:tetratricopeptide repeat protein n=2 Tax=Niameybacter sp. TaxID=2033640 RepID=UPI002FCCB374
MRRNNSANIILVLGAVMSILCSFVLKNVILGIGVFLVVFGIVLYKQRASFIASSAVSAYKKGNFEKSFSLYEKAIAIQGCSNMIKIVYAYRLICEGEVSQGAKVLGALNTEQMDANERLNYNATNALSIWKQGGLHRAIEIYEALLNEKESVLIYETLGYLLICEKDYEKALAFNLKAVELYSTNERMQSNLATSYYYLGQHQEAAKIFKSLIEDYANFPEPYYYYGRLLETREKYKGAVKYWNMALEKKFSGIYSLAQEDIQDKINEIEENMASEA